MGADDRACDDGYRQLKRRDGQGHARFLTFSCFHKRRYLRSERSRSWVIDGIDRARARHGFALWAYVVMPDHVHLLIVPSPEKDTVGPILGTLKLSVTRRAVLWLESHAPSFLKTMQDVQPNGRAVVRFWQPGTGYDRNMFSPRHIWETIAYIHKNPVKRELCERDVDWRWSSAAEFANSGSGPLALDKAAIPRRPTRTY